MKMDESLVSGVEKIKEYFGSPDDGSTNNILASLDKGKDVKKPERQLSIVSPADVVKEQVEYSQISSSNQVDNGRVKGWKERLEMLRQEKEKERSI